MDPESIPKLTRVFFRIEKTGERYGYELYQDGNFVAEGIGGFSSRKVANHSLFMPENQTTLEFRVYKLQATKRSATSDDYIRVGDPEILTVTLKPGQKQQQEREL